MKETIEPEVQPSKKITRREFLKKAVKVTGGVVAAATGLDKIEHITSDSASVANAAEKPKNELDYFDDKLFEVESLIDEKMGYEIKRTIKMLMEELLNKAQKEKDKIRGNQELMDRFCSVFKKARNVKMG